MESRKIIGIGETVLDIVLKKGQPQAAVPGGSTFNAMISLGRAVSGMTPGVPVSMVTSVGDDRVADLVISFMEENGVDSRLVQKAEGHKSAVSLAFLDEGNNASYEFFRDPESPATAVPEISIGPDDIVIFGSYFAVAETSRESVKHLLTKAREAGAMIYYDINFRPGHIAELPVLKSVIEENCAMSDVVRGSDEDIFNIYGENDPCKAYETRISKLCRTFICTGGAKKTTVFSPGVVMDFAVNPVKTVSTIGAGDNFNAGFIYAALKNGFNANDMRMLTAADWETLVPVAHSFSADVCQSIFNYISPEFAASLQ